MTNEVVDITEDMEKAPKLVRMLQAIVPGVDEPVQAKIWVDDGIHYATYSHTHDFPPTDTPRQSLESMVIIASHYLRDFKNEGVTVNHKFQNI